MNFEQEQVWRRLAGNSGNYYSQVAEPEREEFRGWVKNLLHSGEILIEFEKSDGSVRVMTCTLSDLHGAKYTQTPLVEVAAESKSRKVNIELAQLVATPAVSKTRKVNTDACAVWDIAAGAWRSFRWDRLKRIDLKIE